MDGGAGMKPKKQWDHKWYTEEFLQQLKATAAVEMDGDLPYITKYAPDAGSPNGIDPRLLGGPMGKMARSTGLLVLQTENITDKFTTFFGILCLSGHA